MLWKEEIPPLKEDLEKGIDYIRHRMKAGRIP
jgi:hypothetical protein